MAPKAKAATTASKKESKAEKAAEKPSKKGGKAAAQEKEVEAAPAGDAPAIDQDELEEAEDAAAASSSGGNSNDAALAAASGSGEMSASFKNFRHHPDMENFYRFIFENDLRHEALAIIDEIMVEKVRRRTAGKPGKSAH
jgi:hypothetical protein